MYGIELYKSLPATYLECFGLSCLGEYEYCCTIILYILFCYNIDRLGATSILFHNNVVQKYCPSMAAYDTRRGLRRMRSTTLIVQQSAPRSAVRVAAFPVQKCKLRKELLCFQTVGEWSESGFFRLAINAKCVWKLWEEIITFFM